MRFSERIGQRPVKTILQVESIDEPLRNRLWNNINEELIDCLPHDSRGSMRIEVLKTVWRDFFILPMDDIPIHASQYSHFIDHLRAWFYSASWAEAYDLVEYMTLFDNQTHNQYSTACNESLETEVSGYRIIDGQVVQITTSEEIEAIEEALTTTGAFKVVSKHLKTALDLLSDRQSPDYRNSIKESISAIEAICTLIVGDPKANLSKALAILEKQHSLHSALKEAYIKIYSYTSDANGIRHALLEDEVPIEFEDAKFMLVSCSAFINYLKAKLKL